ncbi:hypothetical protein AHF37_02350 [Paragonimus kellicotti]|nr:hypothetical protein AHF37_02350 [Paragonimus kellicotti]
MSIFSFLLILWIIRLVGANVIEGTLTPLPGAPADWYVHARIHVEGTEHVGFVKSDGSFEVHGLQSGSYVVEPLHPSFIFQTARVDINSKGRIRARRVNAPQPNAVKELPYPLRLTCSGKAVYFKPREQLRTIDLLFNPCLLYVLVPFLLVMVLTKLVNTNDPELQKELQQINLQQQLPDMGENTKNDFNHLVFQSAWARTLSTRLPCKHNSTLTIVMLLQIGKRWSESPIDIVIYLDMWWLRNRRNKLRASYPMKHSLEDLQCSKGSKVALFLLSSMSIFGGSKKTAGSGRRRTGAEDSRVAGAISDASSPSGSGGRKEKKRRA